MAFNKRFAGLQLQEQGIDLKQFEKDFLSAHNEYRKLHGSAPLQLNQDLCKSAQQWADHLLSVRALQHSDTKLGENLYYKSSSNPKDLPGNEPVASWYSEIENYNFSKPGFSGNTGHFTQVVWKDSKEVGFGLATDGKRVYFLVAQYNPAGNITNPGYFERNVLPAGAATPTDSTGSDSRWKPAGNKEPVAEKTYNDRTPFSDTNRGTEGNQFEKDFVSAHNAYRKKHGAPPLQLNRELCRSAQQWADHLLSIRTLKHSGTDHGENLYYKYSSSTRELPGQEAVDSWYDEIKNYDFGRPGFRSNTGHFTQVVWKDSKEVGVGVATDGNGLFFVVGQYNPAGNITNPGYFEKNVLPLGSAVSTDSDGSGSRWKPGGTKTYVPEKTGDRKPVSGVGRQVNLGTFEQEALDAHNKYRQSHGAPPLQLSRELCESGQKWADHLLSINALQHSNTSHGENLWYKWDSSVRDASGSEVVETWYNEIKDYNFSKPGFQSNTGHFTQVVWKDSREVGIAKAVDGKGMVIAVAQYSPAGNITNPGYFQKNVLPKGTPVSEGASGSSDRGTGTSYYPAPRGGDPSTTSTVDTRAFALDFLKVNNAYRLQHGAKPLQLNSRISQEAQKWAEHLLTLKTLKHSDTSCGENIWAKTGGSNITVTGQEVAESWYKEEKNYSFSKPGHQPDTGHFTQMVWKSSKEVGVGIASSGKGMFIVVAQYNPCGNVTNPGFYARNVLPRGSKVTDDGDDDEDGFVKDSASNGIVDIPEKDLKSFRKDLLSEHNKYRRLHSAGALQLNAGLSQEAQKWADHLVGIRALQNSDTERGENLWYRWGTDASLPTGKEVAESWYNEITKYSFSSPGFQSGAGNFTQMIWKGSAQVGFGLSTDNKGMYIAVGFYDPAGNIANKGYFEDNVLPKKK